MVYSSEAALILTGGTQTRHMLPDGFFKYVVQSVKDLEVLLMHNKIYAAEVRVPGPECAVGPLL